MQILQVFNAYRQRGGEEVWADKLPGLLGSAYEVRDLRFRSTDWTGSNAPSKWRQIRWMGDNPEARRGLRAAVAEFKPAVLLFHNLIPVASLGLYDEARKLGVPVVQYIHNFRPFSPSGSLWLNGRVNDAALRGNPWPEILVGAWANSRLKTAVLAWHLWRLRRSGALDAVKVWIAISGFMRDKFIAAGIPADRVVLLPHCWEDAGRLPQAGEGDYYLFLGRLCPEKGVSTLLAAWAMLEGRLGQRCPRLVIAGEGPLAGQVAEVAAKCAHIEFAGFVEGETKADLLASCRALIAPSLWWEPLGLIVHEAYAHGRPVIAARSGGLVETVHDRSSGFLFEPGNATQLADCVERVETAGAQGRSALGVLGCQWLQDEASPAKWRVGIRSLLNQAVAGAAN